MTIELVVGWTGPLDFICQGDGVAVDLTGCSAQLIIKNESGATHPFTGTISIVDAAAGKVRILPAAADLSPAGITLLVRVKITDSLARITFFPSGDPDKWEIKTQ